MNNLKFKDMSIIGKVWNIAELLQAGIRDNKESYIIASLKKITELQNLDLYKTSSVIERDSMDYIMINATNVLHKSKYKDAYYEIETDGSIICDLWNLKIELDTIKERIKDSQLLQDDLMNLKNIYQQIKLMLFKNESLSHEEKVDLLKIYKEIKHLYIKIETRAERNQITII